MWNSPGTGTESQIDLIGNLGGIPMLDFFFSYRRQHESDRPLDPLDLACALLWRKQRSVLSLNQSAMKAQQRGWLEENGDTTKPTWLNPKRAKPRDQSIPEAEIG
jgi:hypothetical protein